ncbi:hypothetical protein [Streptomyces sp. NBC_00203]|uniref:hypothetical protein n=1 Tax=Streptomyces sp. NBC_00203 TaxID=2975680 RepID=UPI00324AE6D1
MSTSLEGPLRLPASAVPDGCRSWDGESARRWTQALPPRWVPIRVLSVHLLSVPLVASASAFLWLFGADMSPYLAALLALHVVWMMQLPEVVLVSAPALAVVLAAERPGLPWAIPLAAALALSWASALVRLRSRTRQRHAALNAADGVTAPLPGAAKPLERGMFLLWAGLLLAVLGAVVLALSGLPDAAQHRQVVRMGGCFVLGLGLTVVLSGLLGRRRARLLRRMPVPVLRVRIRDNEDVCTEVYAADDWKARRPLFVVPLRESTDDHDHDDDMDDEELERLLDELEDDDPAPGPLREALLYGVPYDSAEVLVVSAAEEPGEPPVVEWSTGVVRPLSEAAVRRRTAKEKALAARDAAYEERSAAASAAVRESAEPVRRWRAGWPDWLSAAAIVVWGAHFFWGETGLWRYAIGVALGAFGVWMLPPWVAWRITADGAGLWFNGLRRTHHIAWDHIRIVQCKRNHLKIDSHRATFPEWSAFGPRWPWLERKLGLIHPYEKAAAQITAMWQDPALRPAGDSGERELGRPLWPVAVVAGLGWVALLVLLP